MESCDLESHTKVFDCPLDEFNPPYTIAQVLPRWMRDTMDRTPPLAQEEQGFGVHTKPNTLNAKLVALSKKVGIEKIFFSPEIRHQRVWRNRLYGEGLHRKNLADRLLVESSMVSLAFSRARLPASLNTARACALALALAFPH